MWLSLCLPLLAVPDEKSTGGTFASQYQASGERPANRDIAPAEKRQWNHGGGGGGGGGFEESYTCWERVDMDGVELGDMSLLDNDDWIECKRRCSKRVDCIGVQFKEANRGRKGCQEYKSLRRWTRPKFSGVSTSCIKMDLPSVRPLALTEEAQPASRAGRLASVAAASLLVFAAVVVGLAVRPQAARRAQTTEEPSTDAKAFVAGAAIA
mmetsp:Transcript_21478/g.69356  ORF Transcript_21478/g.69356 Transcript_21478/m.69356 type:complete len:210 (+) Transcript_21478:14-643(+)